ncbi:MAG: glucose 1-dehydrogenase [Pseudomonadota bacterium]
MAAARTVIITGGAGGIGKACARRFAKAGDNVVIVDIKTEEGEALVEDIITKGGEAVYVNADVADRLCVHNVMARALDAFGRVDVLVNAVGVYHAGEVLDTSEEDYDRVLRANLKAPFLMSQAAAKQMEAQIDRANEPPAPGRYAIINLSSVQAVATGSDAVVYAASKGGLNQLTKAMALALAPVGVRVNAVAPGSIKTDIEPVQAADADEHTKVLSRTPLGRIGDPEEVAGVVFFLASEEASYVTGQCIYVEGGRLALNYLAEKAE